MTPLQNIPFSSIADRTVAVLAVSADEWTHGHLREIFSHSNWKIHGARGCNEARTFLCETMVGVVLCDCELADGTWREMLEFLAGLPWSPLLIVASEDADDDLWAEVLNLGSYDFLVKPFDRTEVTRVISLAWLHWREGMAKAQKTVA